MDGRLGPGNSFQAASVAVPQGANGCGAEARAPEQWTVGLAQHSLTQILFLTLPSPKRNPWVNTVLYSQQDHGGTD